MNHGTKNYSTDSPQYPHGRKADPTPKGFPADIKNLPILELFKKPSMRNFNLITSLLREIFITTSMREHLMNPNNGDPIDHRRILITVSNKIDLNNHTIQLTPKKYAPLSKGHTNH